VKLYTLWHSGRQDNYACTSAAATPRGGCEGAGAIGYTVVRTEAYILPAKAAGTTPLYTFWHSGRQDNYACTSAAAVPTGGCEVAGAAGYTGVRVEGYVFTTKVAGTTPLYTFWHSGRGDNFTCTDTALGGGCSTAVGYTYVRIEGFVYPAR
jgi:hypothetical protein